MNSPNSSPILSLVPREPQEDDKYYPLLKDCPKNQLWFTEDVVLIVLRAMYRDGSGTAGVDYIMEQLGVPYESQWTKEQDRQWNHKMYWACVPYVKTNKWDITAVFEELETTQKGDQWYTKMVRDENKYPGPTLVGRHPDLGLFILVGEMFSWCERPHNHTKIVSNPEEGQGG